MKKNILIIQSLLVLPLLTPSLIFSMEKPYNRLERIKQMSKEEEGNIDKEMQEVEKIQEQERHNRIKERQKPLLNQLKASIIAKNTSIDENLSVETNPTDLTVAVIENEVINLTLPSRVTIAEAAQPADVTKMSNEKKALFETLHSQLLETIKTDDNESLKTYLKSVKDQLITAPKEHQEQFKKVLAEGTSVKLKPLTIDNPMLSESIMITPMPTKKGIAKSLYLYSYSTQTNDAITHALENGYFEMDNEDHVKALETLLEYFVEQKNVDKIISILEMCQFAAGKLQINDKVARKIHNFLEDIAAEQEKEAQLTLDSQTTDFIATNNALIASLQEELAKRAKEMTEKHTQYQANRKDDFTKKANYIRTLKTGTTIIHTLAPQLRLAKNESCSDKIHFCSPSNEYAKSPKSKVYMTQGDVDAIYSNDRLLSQMQLDKPIAAITQNSSDLLAHVSAIQRATLTIELLTK